MPQPRNASSSTEPPAGAEAEAPAKPAAKRAGSKPRTTSAKASSAASKPRAAKTTAAKTTAAKTTSAKAAAAASKPRAAKTTATKATAAKATTAKTAGKPTSKAGPTKAKAATSKEGAAQRGGADDTGRSKPRIEIHLGADAGQLELIAERLRKLNERIIELGREAGESRLASYEKALKTIAGNISQGPAKDELEWITQLASSQAKFVREITDSWAKAARDRFK